jgi:uncharacterized membrane protein YbhN (UPF0104 family)
LKKVIGLTVAAVILFFIIRNLISGLGDLEAYELRISYWRVLAAFGVLGLLFPVYGRIWQYILKKFGYGLTFAQSMRIWFLSQAGRYVPGKVWFALGRIYLCEREGIPRSIATVATGFELVLVLGSAIVVFGLVSLMSPSLGGQPYGFWIWLVPVIVVGVHPRIIRSLLMRLKRAPEGFAMKYTDTLKMLALYVMCWCVYGIGFFFIGTSLKLSAGTPIFKSANATGLIPEMIGINSLSWAGGLLSILTPAGLGVREGISGVLLAGIALKPYPSLIPLAARIWVTLAEIGTIGLLLVWKGRR